MLPLRTEKNFILFDQEESDPRWKKVTPIRLFQNTRSTASDVTKVHGVHTNLVGCGGSLPNGQTFDLKAIRVSGWLNDEARPSKLKGSPRVTFRFGGSDGPPPIDMNVTPGELVQLGKTIRIWGMECFQVDVSEASAPVRVELHGDLYRYGHSNVMSPDGSRMFMLSESEIKALTPLVERAIPPTTDKRERWTLSYLLSSLKDYATTLNGDFHAAQLVRGEVSVTAFRTPEAREAYKKAFGVLCGVEDGTADGRCWNLPEEIDKIEDEATQKKVMNAWEEIMAPLRSE